MAAGGTAVVAGATVAIAHMAVTESVRTAEAGQGAGVAGTGRAGGLASAATAALAVLVSARTAAGAAAAGLLMADGRTAAARATADGEPPLPSYHQLHETLDGDSLLPLTMVAIQLIDCPPPPSSVVNPLYLVAEECCLFFQCASKTSWLTDAMRVFNFISTLLCCTTS